LFLGHKVSTARFAIVAELVIRANSDGTQIVIDWRYPWQDVNISIQTLASQVLPWNRLNLASCVSAIE
jgi:hypothetical protein